MRDLQKIYKECVQECKDAGIPIRDDKVLSISVGTEEEMINDYGLCYVNEQDLTFEMYVNSLLLDENCPIIELKNTIIHELIHTCPRCGIQWCLKLIRHHLF